MRVRPQLNTSRLVVAVIAAVLVISSAGCSSHACKLGGFPPDITLAFFDLRPLGLAADPALTFTMCSNGRCETRVRPNEPAVISGAGSSAGEKLDNVTLKIENGRGDVLFASQPATGPFEVDEFHPNGEGCEPREFQRWFAANADGRLTLVSPQSQSLR